MDEISIRCNICRYQYLFTINITCSINYRLWEILSEMKLLTTSETPPTRTITKISDRERTTCMTGQTTHRLREFFLAIILFCFWPLVMPFISKITRICGQKKLGISYICQGRLGPTDATDPFRNGSFQKKINFISFLGRKYSYFLIIWYKIG